VVDGVGVLALPEAVDLVLAHVIGGDLTEMRDEEELAQAVGQVAFPAHAVRTLQGQFREVALHGVTEGEPGELGGSSAREPAFAGLGLRSLSFWVASRQSVVSRLWRTRWPLITKSQ
jgi:hypothetical protein